MPQDDDKPEWLIASEEREKKKDKEDKKISRIVNIIWFGGIGSFLLYDYFTANEHQREITVLIVVGGLICYNIERRLIAIYKKLENIEERLRG